MRSLTALLCIVFGGYIVGFAFRLNAKRLLAMLLGGLLVVLGFSMLPHDSGGPDRPGVHQRR